MKYLILFVALAISLHISSQDFKKIDSIVTSKIKKGHPGLAIGIVKNGKIIYEKYLGLSNLQHQVKFDEKTRSNIASTAKQFTALMILQLSLESKISLEDDVRKYLTKIYPKVKEEIKIRHLLNHTSGIRDYVELLDMDGDVWWQRFGYDNDDVLKLIENQEDLGFKPGSTYSYSNTNYNLLTKVIEKVTGKSFNEYSKNFFENLGMNETSFLERYMKVIPNRANPYSDWGRGEWWEVPTVTKTNGEGFLFTTLQDQLRYEKAVQNAKYNNNILLIESQQSIPNSEIKTYGFGLELEDRFNRKTVHHSGGTYGFNSQVYRFPNEKLTIFAMSNNGNISTNMIAQQIAKIVLPKSDSKPKYDAKLYDNNSNTAKYILGKYIYPNKNSVVEILKKDNKLFWKERNFTVEIVDEGNNIFKFTNNQKLKVRFYTDKIVEFYTSGKTMEYKRISKKSLFKTDLRALVGNYFNRELKISFDIKLNKNDKLQLKLSTDNGYNDVIIYNDKFLLADSYFLTLKRDQFNRVTEILLTYGRALNIKFKKKTNLKYQPKIPTDNGSIQVSTIGAKKGNTTDILLTKNDAEGNEIWDKRLGGSSWDKASSILETKDGYLIVGSTSSYGKGNYDFYVIKTDRKGKKIWQKTYGGFYNEYGKSAEITNKGYRIKGTKQNCTNNSNIDRECTTSIWFVDIDENGSELSNQILETIE